MATDVSDRQGSLDIITIDSHPTIFGDKTVLECRVLICPEDDGGYSVFALRLPGVASQGETVAEALTNIEEAFRATVRSYLDDAEAIPWEDAEIERSSGSLERWILVDV